MLLSFLWKTRKTILGWGMFKYGCQLQKFSEFLVKNVTLFPHSLRGNVNIRYHQNSAGLK